jgi:hypothetical protein
VPAVEVADLAVRRRAIGWALGVAALCALALAIAFALSGAGGNDRPGPGPLYVGEANRLANPQPVGVPFAYGIPVVFNGADRPLELRRISLVDATPGLELVRVYAAGPRRRYDFASTDPVKGLPGPRSPFTDLHPVAGYPVAPAATPAGQRGVNLVIVLRAPRAGRFGFRGVRVDSRRGGTEYRNTFPNAYVACAGPFQPNRSSPPCHVGPPGIGEVRPGA